MKQEMWTEAGPSLGGDAEPEEPCLTSGLWSSESPPGPPALGWPQLCTARLPDVGFGLVAFQSRDQKGPFDRG